MLGKFTLALAIVSTPVMMGSGIWAWRDGWLRSGLPDGIAAGNGRIESVRVDVATKYAGRVGTILAREGDLVKPGQVVAQMNTDELEADLARGKAKIAEGREIQNQIRAEILEKESRLKFAQQRYERDKTLFERRVVSRESVEQSRTQRDVDAAALEASKSRFQANQRTIEAAEADARRVEAQIAEATLTAPVEGRVLYRLAEEGEVLPAGGKVFTLVNLTDVYMEIFLPAREAARASIGAEARIVSDIEADGATRAVVSFFSPEAQFTPKHVETRSERDKLMFRVKLQIPRDWMHPQIEKVKTGVRGVGYVRLDDAVAWPSSLEARRPRADSLSFAFPSGSARRPWTGLGEAASREALGIP